LKSHPPFELQFEVFAGFFAGCRPNWTVIVLASSQVGLMTVIRDILAGPVQRVYIE
jgi:hypothetical protein